MDLKKQSRNYFVLMLRAGGFPKDMSDEQFDFCYDLARSKIEERVPFSKYRIPMDPELRTLVRTGTHAHALECLSKIRRTDPSTQLLKDWETAVAVKALKER